MFFDSNLIEGKIFNPLLKLVNASNSISDKQFSFYINNKKTEKLFFLHAALITNAEIVLCTVINNLNST